MSLLPLPDSAVQYTKDGRPTKEFYNWLKSLETTLREHGITLVSLSEHAAKASLEPAEGEN